MDSILLIIATLFHVLGVLAAPHALVRARTSEGAIAWAISLVSLPYIALPLYIMIGRSKFVGYIKARRMSNTELRQIYDKVLPRLHANRSDLSDRPNYRVFEDFAELPFSRRNVAKLWINGDAAFEEMFRVIRNAKDYVLLQFFIVRADSLGHALADLLIEKAGQGVKVYFLFDQIGCVRLPNAYIQRLRAGGVDMRPFRNTQGRWVNRFQINFRNHRKVVVADGYDAWLGGMNVGDEYRGRGKKFPHWRDTALVLRGPAVDSLQLAWVEDWFWATNSLPNLRWDPAPEQETDQEMLIMPTGPSDPLETCNLMFTQAIHIARRRVWIASPYFVPDREVTAALQLAALRGVDVRLLLPNQPDHVVAYLASFSCLTELHLPHVQIYRYEKGFMHQKVMLVDDDLSFVGTANIDHRSFRLNFEVTALIHDAAFAREVEAMLVQDFSDSRRAAANEIEHRSRLFQLGCRLSRLFAPIL